MPRVELGPPPTLTGSVTYSDYKPHLLAHFFDHICSYCLLHNRDVQVEHYVPVSFDRARKHDPANLLLACPSCNGPGGKGDYHPLHQKRQRYPKDRTAYFVVDVRADDFAEMFHLNTDGSIHPRGSELDRAAWNISLLKLDLLNEYRLDVLELADSLEVLLEMREEARDSERVRTLMDKLTPPLVRRALLLQVFGVKLSPNLIEHLRANGARLLAHS